MHLFDLLYFLVLVLGAPFWLRYLFNPAARGLLRGRFAPPLLPGGGRSVWIHAVSVGEVRSLAGLIAELRRDPARAVVLSVTTPAGYACARRDYPDILVTPAPFDFSFVVRRFIRRLRPELMLFNELEVWPNWLRCLHRRGIPMLLINGRMSERAFARYRLTRALWRPLLNRFTLLLVQAELYRQRFTALGVAPERLRVCGNIKADQALEAAARLPGAAEVVAALGQPPTGLPRVTLASSHASDEAVFLPAAAAVRGRFHYVIVPRHVERAVEIERRVLEFGLTCRVFSRAPRDGGEEVLIYDRMGYLLPILSVSAAVVMGGTWESRIGGHNLYEPAALARPLAGGPHCNNFPDIGGELAESGAYRITADSAALQRWLRDLPADGGANPAARRSVERRLGSLACTVSAIRSCLGC